MRLRRVLTSLVCIPAVALCIVAAGCGSSEGDSGTAATDSPPADPGTAPSTPAPAPNPNANPEPIGVNTNVVQTGPGGQPMVGQVPLNVWYSNPIGVANGSVPVAGVTDGAVGNPVAIVTPVPGVGAGATGAGMSGGTPATTPDPAPMPSGGPAWDKIPVAIVQDEVKNQVNSIRTDLASVRSYNDAYPKIQTKSAVIAGLAEMALDHSGDIRWKENAHYLREFAVKVKETANARGGGQMRMVEAEFEQIGEILAGSVPAAADPATPKDRPLSEVAERGYLMERIETAQKWLSSNIITQEKFDEEKERVTIEAGVLLALFQIVGHESYDSADEDEYKGFINEAVSSSDAMLAAINGGDFEGFKAALGTVERQCNECHQAYYFAD